MLSRTTSLVLIAPWLVTLAVFWVYPLAFSFWLSFHEYSLVAPDQSTWIGWTNFTGLWTDPATGVALRNTLLYVAGVVPATTVAALLLANLLNTIRRFRTLARNAIFLPSMVSMAVVSLIFVQLYTRGGFLHTASRWIGLAEDRLGLLLQESTALPAIMVMDVFVHAGYYAILFLAGIQSISVEQYEEAQLCGAGWWRQFRKITVPQLTPLILFSLVLNSIRTFQIYTEIYLMTKGGPLHATTTWLYRTYEIGFQEFQLGKASAMAYILLLIVGLFVGMQMRMFKKFS